METSAQIKLENSYFEVPHKNGTISFYHPPFNGGYGNIAEQMSKQGLKHPTPSETVSLMVCAFQNEWGNKEREVIDIFNKKFFWEYTGNFFLPKSGDEINNGVILEENPKIENGRLIMEKADLIRRLRNNDPLIKFVPFDFKSGLLSYRELEKNPYILAKYGEEGAQKLAKLASEHYNPGYNSGNVLLNVYSYSDGVIANKVEKSLSQIGNCWFYRNIGIEAIHSSDDYFSLSNEKGYAFGRK